MLFKCGSNNGRKLYKVKLMHYGVFIKRNYRKSWNDFDRC